MPARLAALAALALLAARPALADRAVAESCAQSLSPEGQTIYRAAAPLMRPGTDIAGLLREEIRPMVLGGQLGIATARSQARAAAACLQALQN
jgi:hypothetical protein